jgi:hypothetical protein
VGRLRDFDSIVAYLSAREIDELQAAIDARRQAREVRPDEPPEARSSRHGSRPDEEPGSDPRRAAGV